MAALWHRVLVWLIVGAKLGAVLFLFGQSFFIEARFHLILSGIGDPCLGLLVLVTVMVDCRARSGAVISEGEDTGDGHTVGWQQAVQGCDRSM